MCNKSSIELKHIKFDDVLEEFHRKSLKEAQLA